MAASGGHWNKGKFTPASAIKAFKDEFEADAWAEKATGAWLEGLSLPEYEAIRAYTSRHWYKSINEALRKDWFDPADDPRSAARVNRLDAALARGGLPEPVTAKRFIAGGWLDGHKVGDVIMDKGYVSTSINPEHGLYAVPSGAGHMIDIHIPAGHPGGYVQPITKFKSNYEYLLPRGTKFRVTKVDATTGQVTGLAVVG